MNRHAAADELAVWLAIVKDTDGPTVQRQAVAGLLAAAEWFATEVARLERTIAADVASMTEAAKIIRDLRQQLPAASFGRALKAFALEHEAIDDARRRAQCVVIRTDGGAVEQATGAATYWSVPLERYARDGIQLGGPWRHGTHVEIDPAVPLIRPLATGAPPEPVQWPRRAS